MNTDRLAVFDLDGTLVDTAPDLSDTTNFVLAGVGLSPISPDILRNFIGMGARAMIEKALEKHGVARTPAEIDALRDVFTGHYATRIARHSRAFPQMLAALDALAAAGVAVAVCTNKREALARQLLDELSLTDRFAAICGGDTFATSKPDPEPLFGTIALAGGQPARTVYVGDSRIDFETARAARIPMVGVTYGYSDVPITELGPERLCGPGEDVAAAILELMGID